jgi:hypothetical protein
MSRPPARKTRASALADGPPHRPDGTGNDRGSPHPSEHESRYDSHAQAKPGHKLKVRIEIVVVDGPDGKHLRARQAAAMRRALQWFAEHQNQPRTPTKTEVDSSP